VAQLSAIHYRMDRVRAALGTAVAIASNVGMFVGIALLAGFGSSWYMIERGSRLTTLHVGPWTTWVAAGRANADPYTRARFARQGSLPIPADLARTYEAFRDGDGDRLHSSCEYAVEGEGLESGWWSLAVFDEKGRLIPNTAERHAFNSQTIARGPDGSFLVTLSRDARPGNWLPTSGAGRLALVLTVHANRASSGRADDSPDTLPLIRKVACR
jgi:hypothetical protein